MDKCGRISSKILKIQSIVCADFIAGGTTGRKTSTSCNSLVNYRVEP